MAHIKGRFIHKKRRFGGWRRQKGGSSTKRAVLVDGEGKRMAKAGKDGEGERMEKAGRSNKKTAACKAPETYRKFRL